MNLIAAVARLLLGGFYRGIKPIDLFEDLIFRNKGYEARRVLLEAMPQVSKGLKYLPVFFLLRAAGVNNRDEYAMSEYDVDKYLELTPEDFRAKNLRKGYMRNYRELSVSEMIQKCTPEIVAQYLPFAEWQREDYDGIQQFLAANIDRFQTSNYSTAFRKLACLYDRAMYGWE